MVSFRLITLLQTNAVINDSVLNNQQNILLKIGNSGVPLVLY